MALGAGHVLIMATVRQGQLRSRALHSAHDHFVGIDVFVPIPGLLENQQKKWPGCHRQCSLSRILLTFSLTKVSKLNDPIFQMETAEAQRIT